jgi:hypothetical protein
MVLKTGHIKWIQLHHKDSKVADRLLKRALKWILEGWNFVIQLHCNTITCIEDFFAKSRTTLRVLFY